MCELHAMRLALIFLVLILVMAIYFCKRNLEQMVVEWIWDNLTVKCSHPINRLSLSIFAKLQSCKFAKLQRCKVCKVAKL